MTRLTLLSTLVTAPLAALAGASGLATEKQERIDVAFGPGTIRIGESGRIAITGATDVRIEGCEFHGCATSIS